ncbi:unnamed protein product [Rotaria socialis]|uniref:PRKCA-binding protein n=1 Tax=Rotaria socialis TaxID=392032 RepID=A0A820JAH0_9BILA|nr:unnamed protein product [Rotaria socialis]CAF3488856.1 unnamed protein product [Rotaria socialis]CAF3739764.1 unnamed protein product [Rotaria socialis]CAF4320860.1 unnamed protein product [Rotaria socialis]CAF4444617.1 unnamed protein product [Rotaria socialis]
MYEYYDIEENTLGTTLTSGTCTLTKNDENLIGISLGGGYPYCPCLFIVQVFDNSPVSKDGSLAAGDEIVSINGESVKGRTKHEAAKMITSAKADVTIHYNKLHAQPQEGKTLDIILKKVKHRIIEAMSSTTADALGLSRAILVNDSLVNKLTEIEAMADLYRGLIKHTRKVLIGIYDLAHIHRDFGDTFANIGAREPQVTASQAFTKFGDAHRQMNQHAMALLAIAAPMVADFNTYLTKAIPDTRLTVQKYADAKFEYLSYCLKVKEMNDEEQFFNSQAELLYRVESGNYEYRIVLRCRQLARDRFAKMRSDVLVKLELLDQKRVQDIVFQLHRLMAALDKYHRASNEIMQEVDIFPIAVDIALPVFSKNENDDQDQDQDQDQFVDIPHQVNEDPDAQEILDDLELLKIGD